MGEVRKGLPGVKKRGNYMDKDFIEKLEAISSWNKNDERTDVSDFSASFSVDEVPGRRRVHGKTLSDAGAGQEKITRDKSNDHLQSL